MERIEFDFRQLTALIVAIFGSRKAFAEKMGISKGTLSMRLNNKSRWPIEDIMKACDLLCIDPKEIGIYFFTPKVR